MGAWNGRLAGRSQLTSPLGLNGSRIFLGSVLQGCPWTTNATVRLSFPVPPSVITLETWYRNINLLSIAYAFRPRLRSRLTQGGRTFPWKPWVYGPWDSHPRLATHANILTRVLSTCPFGHASTCTRSSPTHHNDAVASVVRFSPDNFRRKITRPVSYYALFK